MTARVTPLGACLVPVVADILKLFTSPRTDRTSIQRPVTVEKHLTRTAGWKVQHSHPPVAAKPQVRLSCASAGTAKTKAATYDEPAPTPRTVMSGSWTAGQPLANDGFLGGRHTATPAREKSLPDA